MQLYEKYRPRTWEELVGQDAIKQLIDNLRPRGLAGRSYFISGPSGYGKTTTARLIAREVADDWAIEEMDAADCTVDRLRDIRRLSASRPLGGRGWCFIVNEVHGLRGEQLRQFLTILEGDGDGGLAPFVTWIFTTTTDGQNRLFDKHDDALPFLSRSIQLKLCQRCIRSFAARAKYIAEAERLGGASIGIYESLFRKSKYNFRTLLQMIETGAARVDCEVGCVA